MKYCSKCLQPDTRPGIEFREDGICSACVYQLEKKPQIDWYARKLELAKIVACAKAQAKGPYDGVLGVSGGQVVLSVQPGRVHQGHALTNIHDARHIIRRHNLRPAQHLEFARGLESTKQKVEITAGDER